MGAREFIKKIRTGFNKINKKILTIIISIFIPVLLLFIYGAYLTGVNVNKASDAVKTTLPSALAYNQLERNVMKMQKWITYTCATRAEQGYDNGFTEAEIFYKLTANDINKLKKIFKNDTEELKRLDILKASIKNYFDVGSEVANAYIEGGTFYGNAMLDVFALVENKLNTELRDSITHYTQETVKINQSIETVLNNTKILFIALGVLVFILGFVGYMFMVKRAELHSSNKKLSDAMDSLWGEMQLAKKIQTVLLPKKPAIPGYDITGYMMPADDVGGDYYDIINVDGKDWMVIGDVSGHGVPAGLVMMMVQTAIQTTLRQYPGIPPSDLLETINKVIATNIHRLGEDKYMTLTVLACHDDGNFTFSGLHQDIMIYRNSTKNIELIETTGMWIGLLENVENMNVDDSFQLNTGDILLLYTDGITEAMDENEKMFSEKKLATTLLKYSENGSIESIKDGIIDALANYDCHDDVTMVVLKRL